MISWGITIVCFILIGVMVLSQLLKYPDLISIKDAEIKSNPEPVYLVSEGNGLIDSVYFQNDQLVKEGQLLAVITTVSHESIELFAPLDGKVLMVKDLKKGTSVEDQERVCVILAESLNINATVYIPADLSVKIQPGQYVNLEIVGYPKEEFGLVKGEVNFKSGIIEDKRLYLNVKLPNGLETSFGKQIPFKPNMKAEAEILLKDLTLLHRLLQSFDSILTHENE